ncbi:MAG: hypothetical protein WKF40_09520 [Thermoleophilaceae bacterium]
MATRIAAGLELTLSQLLRLDEGGAVSVVLASERLRGGTGRRGHAYEVVTPPLPGQRAEVAFHTLAPGTATGGAGDPPMHEPGSRETAVVLDGRAAPALRRRGPRPRTPATPSPSTPTCPTTSRTPMTQDARFLAVVAAGLRRS